MLAKISRQQDEPANDDDRININALAAAIAERLSKKPPIEETLWSSEDCADYLRVSPRHFMDRIASHHRFPTPVRVPTTNGKRCHPRWYAGEIIKWGKSYR